MSRFLARGPVGPAGPFRTSADVLERYVKGLPSAQQAIDLLPGWSGAMPPESGLRAGSAALYADTRIAWLLSECFNARGRSVLELGPLEGLHSYMLHHSGAAKVTAIEANTQAFLRCLVTKEALGLDRVNFLLGDFTEWLEKTDEHYDLIVASGVLYHSHDPVRLLELVGSRADAIFLWTHYFDDVAMPMGDLRRVPFSEAVETRVSHGITVRLHERSYYRAWRDPKFCGGFQDRHFWIERTDIMALLEAMGFDRVVIADDHPGHVNGPSFSVFAERRGASLARNKAKARRGAIAASDDTLFGGFGRSLPPLVLDSPLEEVQSTSTPNEDR